MKAKPSEGKKPEQKTSDQKKPDQKAADAKQQQKGTFLFNVQANTTNSIYLIKSKHNFV